MFVTCKIIDTNHCFLPLHFGGYLEQELDTTPQNAAGENSGWCLWFYPPKCVVNYDCVLGVSGARTRHNMNYAPICVENRNQICFPHRTTDTGYCVARICVWNEKYATWRESLFVSGVCFAIHVENMWKTDTRQSFPHATCFPHICRVFINVADFSFHIHVENGG